MSFGTSRPPSLIDTVQTGPGTLETEGKAACAKCAFVCVCVCNGASENERQVIMEATIHIRNKRPIEFSCCHISRCLHLFFCLCLRAFLCRREGRGVGEWVRQGGSTDNSRLMWPLAVPTPVSSPE